MKIYSEAFEKMTNKIKKTSECKICGGDGWIAVSKKEGAEIRVCPYCRGKGRIEKD